jgi:hypothetical protein
MYRTIGLATAALVAAITLDTAIATAQDLNTRNDAPPSAKAVTGRLMSKSRSIAASQDQDLQRDVINTDCSALTVGGQQQDPRERQSLTRDDTTVIRGNVVNLCR